METQYQEQQGSQPGVRGAWERGSLVTPSMSCIHIPIIPGALRPCDMQPKFQAAATITSFACRIFACLKLSGGPTDATNSERVRPVLNMINVIIIHLKEGLQC